MNFGLKCHTCKGFIRISKVGEETKPMRFKWRDGNRTTQVNVCESCWNKARSLKVPE